MSLIDTSNLTQLDYEVIDQDHHEFAELVNKLNTADKSEFVALFNTLFEHTQAHFERENELMERYGFPAKQEHRGEHHRVLGDFQQFKRRVERGLIPFGRAYVTEQLPGWFDLHVKTMDAALVKHIQSQGD